jgi:hypothetical protein
VVPVLWFRLVVSVARLFNGRVVGEGSADDAEDAGVGSNVFWQLRCSTVWFRYG